MSFRLQNSKCESIVSIIFLLNFLGHVFSQCSGSSQSLTASQTIQYFTSAGYNNGAGTYSSNLDCIWIIDSGASNYKVILYLKNYDVACSGDSINIYDGNSVSGTSLKSNICGTGSSDKIVTSSSQFMTLRFTTDAVNQSVGFETAYFSAADLSGSACTADLTLTPSSTPQYVTSPSFPSLYDVSSNCRWILTVSAGRVQVEIIYSDIETSTNCAFDSLEIYDGDYVCENTKLAAICSRYPNGVTGSYVSNGTSFLLKFKSDGSVSYTGFLIKYTQVEDVVSSDPVTSSEDRLMLGIGIGCACGATGAFLIVFIVTLFKSKCRSPKIVSPRVKTVEPMNGGPHTMRTPSVNGSMDSTDSITHSRNGFIRRPISTSRRSSMVDGKSNGFLP
ncbi:embryonic protein UVS.2-like isoform X2 [Ostrea edulis]|uniref:embryonic protein UVS.2-like isoform X2 n=1 Tax=Ostrea edulis TaxID=37623 RepID=UPI0024AF3DA2|nr:embryonic protein UVS.2-like isoform X2 [Ostrea edulis]